MKELPDMNNVDVFNLVLCFDGTWNTSNPDESNNNDETNVRRISKIVAEGACEDDDGKTVFTQVEYIEGPGTKAGNKISGGLFATDLDEPVKEGYRALFKAARKCAKSHTEFRVYLFGFSRGAYICHLFSWLLFAAGLPKTLGELDGVAQAFLDKDLKALLAKTGSAGRDRITIQFMGLWDAVSSQHDKYKGFFNGMRSPLVKRVCHAMAADERRTLFPVMHYLPDDSVEQTWFPGVHSEVGGGYKDDKGLYGISLGWMVDRAREAGLRFAKLPPSPKFAFAALVPHHPLGEKSYAVRCYWPGDKLHGSLSDRTVETFRPVEFENFESDEINIRL